VGANLGVGEGLAVVVAVAVAVGVAVAVEVGVAVAVEVGVAVGVGPDSAQYLPPVFKKNGPLSLSPPQTIISLPLQTAV